MICLCSYLTRPGPRFAQVNAALNVQKHMRSVLYCILIPITKGVKTIVCLWGLIQRQDTSLGQWIHNLDEAKGKEKYFRETSLPIKRWGKELVSVTDQVWKKQLQTLRNMTKASLHQSIEKLMARLKILFTYVFYMFLITTLALSCGSKADEGSCY